MSDLLLLPNLGSSIPSYATMVSSGYSSSGQYYAVSTDSVYAFNVDSLNAGASYSFNSYTMYYTIGSQVSSATPLSLTITIDGVSYAYYRVQRSSGQYYDSPAAPQVANDEEAIAMMLGAMAIPITYYLTNCSAPSAPTSVQPGGTVSFPVTVSPGYNIFNPVQGGSISVYQGDVYIPFTFENGQLTFTAPGGG